MRSAFNIWPTSLLLLLFNLLVALVFVVFAAFGFDLLPGLDFGRAWPAWGLLLLPLASIMHVVRLKAKNKRLSIIKSPTLREVVFPSISATRHTIKWLLAAMSYLMLLIVLAEPKMGSKLIEVKTRGSDVMVALDVSRSMMAEDVSPNRLEAAKQVVRKLIDNLGGDRIGIIVFAGNASIRLPITADYEAARLFLSNIDTDQMSSQGTDIGLAISLCPEAFDPESPAGKAIVVITDGEDHESSGAMAAEQASEVGITVHTIGLGSDRGAPVPQYESGRRTDRFIKDKDGNTIISALDEETLVNLADKGNGLFVRSSDGYVDLSELLAQLKLLQKDEKAVKTYGEYDHYFAPFALAALVLLLLESTISLKRKTWSTSLGILD